MRSVHFYQATNLPTTVKHRATATATGNTVLYAFAGFGRGWSIESPARNPTTPDTCGFIRFANLEILCQDLLVTCGDNDAGALAREKK